jgi:hypothetical protein
MEFAHGHMEGPVVPRDMFQRVYGEVDALTDAQARGTGQQQGGRREIANDTQSLVQVGIIFGGQGPRQTLIHNRNILTAEKSGRRRVKGCAG